MAISLNVANGRIRPRLPVQALSRQIVVNGFTHRDWHPEPPLMDLSMISREIAVPSTYSHIQLQADGLISADGWLLDMPDTGTPEMLWDWNQRAGKAQRAGNYSIWWEGDGEIRLGNNVANVSLNFGAKSGTFDIVDPGSGGQRLRLYFDAVDDADPIRNIKIVKTANLSLYNAGHRANPAYKAWLRQLNIRAFRNLGFGGINGSTEVEWADRPSPRGPQRRMMAWENFVQFCAEVPVPMWVCIPHMASEDYVTQLATLIRDEFTPDIPVYVQYSNEVWNGKFEQEKWLKAQAAEHWPETSVGPITQRDSYHAKLATKAALIFNDVFGSQSGRLVHVMGGQLASIATITRAMNAAEWLEQEPEDFVDPKTVFHAISPACYFGGAIITNSSRVETIQAFLDDDNPEGAKAYIKSELTDVLIPDTLTRLAAWRDQAAAWGKNLICYEGGQHLVHSFGISIPSGDPQAIRALVYEFFQSEDMVDCYRTIWNAFHDQGIGGFAKYESIAPWSDTNAWSISQHAADESHLLAFFREVAAAPDPWPYGNWSPPE